MADLPSLFLASLNPQTRKEAENTLEQLAIQPSFALHLLTLTLNASQDRAVRLASGVYLKNIARKRWDPVSVSTPLCFCFGRPTSLIPMNQGIFSMRKPLSYIINCY